MCTSGCVRCCARSPLPTWLVLGALSLLVLVDAVIIAMAFLPVRRHPVTSPTEAESAREAIEASLAALEEGGDPRAAVLAAYRRMELALSEAGVPRADSESPREYLERTLGSLELSPTPLAALTSLFERARFSLRRIGPSERDQAMAALRELREELESRTHAIAD